jgi:hypothetical protein
MSVARSHTLPLPAAAPLGVFVVDDLLNVETQRAVFNFLMHGGWTFGWRSSSKTDIFRFWHRHFAGYKKTTGNGKALAYDCADELAQTCPFLHGLWKGLSLFPGHTLIRCYANGTTMARTALSTSTASQIAALRRCIIRTRHGIGWAGGTVIFNDDKTISWPRCTLSQIGSWCLPTTHRTSRAACRTLSGAAGDADV